MPGWAGTVRSGSRSEQSYHTSNELSEYVTNLCKSYPAPYIELGVGSGALFKKLPSPKMGVELLDLTPKIPGVVYNTNALTWEPPRRARGATVVMNPPFARQLDFFNQASRYCDTIIWIAGQNVRMWANEDCLDQMMHLTKEWLVPPKWSVFMTSAGPRPVPAVVQVWQRQHVPRKLWNLRSNLPLCAVQTEPPANAFIVKRVGRNLGVCKRLGRDGKIVSKTADTISTNNGTLHKKLGTGICLLSVPADINKRTGDIARLLAHRTSTVRSLSMPALTAILAPDWKRLIRRIQYIDGKVRHETQW